MTTLTLELSPELYERLRLKAEHSGQSAEAVAQKWLVERLSLPVPAPPDERERVIEVLHAAGLRSELSPGEKQRATENSATLEEVRAALDKANGKLLSELILEMRGPKE